MSLDTIIITLHIMLTLHIQQLLLLLHIQLSIDPIWNDKKTMISGKQLQLIKLILQNVQLYVIKNNYQQYD